MTWPRVTEVYDTEVGDIFFERRASVLDIVSWFFATLWSFVPEEFEVPDERN